jgi:hypothetical protein
MTRIKTIYVTVPVHVWDDGSMSVDFSDDGVPGLWGNAYVYDDNEGEWEFDHDGEAIDHVAGLIAAGAKSGAAER